MATEPNTPVTRSALHYPSLNIESNDMRRLITHFINARKRRIEREVLRSMTDYQLKDIGLCRGDINNVWRKE